LRTRGTNRSTGPGVEHVEALSPLVARHHITQGVVPNVAHMDRTGGVGKHFQHVILFARMVGFSAKRLLVFPSGLPLFLGQGRVVSFGAHGSVLIGVKFRPEFCSVGGVEKAPSLRGKLCGLRTEALSCRLFSVPAPLAKCGFPAPARLARTMARRARQCHQGFGDRQLRETRRGR